MSHKLLIVATRNEGKVKEIRELLHDLPLRTASLIEFPEIPEIVEDQLTFSGNAVKKAETVCSHAGEAALADDSGLEVDALEGRPGVYSARFAGKNSSDEENNRKLLKELENVPAEKRTARFRCVIALALPGEGTITVEGACEGWIGFSPQGREGFGYDPLFIHPSHGSTLAELSPQEKNEISHRGRALAKVRPIIEAKLVR